jgi:hypothetical protein
LALKSSGADSSVLTRSFHKVAAVMVVRTLGTAYRCVGGVKSHPLQKRQRMGHPRHIVVLAVWNPTLCKSGKGWATHGVWLCWRREIPPFAKAAKDGAPREKL